MNGHSRSGASRGRVDLRVGTVADIGALQAIDLDASELFIGAGLDVDLPGEFLQAELERWLQSLASGHAILAVEAGDRVVGFASRGMLDGEPYLDQLSVLRSCMRRGIGRALLQATICAAQETAAQALWLTTYGHLPWNRPYYERAGFAVVPEADCGPEMRRTLALERRFLPRPEERLAMKKDLGRRA